MHRFIAPLLLAAGLVYGAAGMAADTPANIKAAIADKGRPQADTDRDANRMPAEVVAFVGIKTGDKVADINPGGGYFTRIFSKVVGPHGKVYAIVSAPQLVQFPKVGEAIKALQDDAQYGNIVFLATDFERMAVPESIDVAWTSDNYHDFKNRGPGYTAAMNKAIFAALKSGGTYMIIDHAAENGSGARDTNTLHRIDPEIVKSEVLAAGFRFEGASNVLARPSDDHKVAVNDSGIRGKTDQFVFKFKKP